MGMAGWPGREWKWRERLGDEARPCMSRRARQLARCQAKNLWRLHLSGHVTQRPVTVKYRFWEGTCGHSVFLHLRFRHYLSPTR